MKNKQIEALEKLMALKDETIKELERQLQLLKNQPPVVVPQIQPYQPAPPINAPYLPISPQQPWYQPSNPLVPPYIITCGDSEAITNDPNITVTLTNSDNISNVVKLNDANLIPSCVSVFSSQDLSKQA